MRKEKTNKNQEQVVREIMLEPNEVYLLSYLKGFNREKTQEWQKNDLWN